LSSPHAQTGSNIPAPKLELIRQAIVAMKIDLRIQDIVYQRVETKALAIAMDNPEVSDTMLNEIRGTIAGVYAENMEGRDGLMPRVCAVLDRRLTEDDLRFAVDFRGSDQGKRFRELVPRVVFDISEAGRAWGERLEPVITRRLEDRFRGRGVRF
jgi:hypothetical protein